MPISVGSGWAPSKERSAWFSWNPSGSTWPDVKPGGGLCVGGIWSFVMQRVSCLILLLLLASHPIVWDCHDNPVMPHGNFLCFFVGTQEDLILCFDLFPDPPLRKSSDINELDGFVCFSLKSRIFAQDVTIGKYVGHQRLFIDDQRCNHCTCGLR